jgi:hypothetical protein
VQKSAVTAPFEVTGRDKGSWQYDELSTVHASHVVLLTTLRKEDLLNTFSRGVAVSAAAVHHLPSLVLLVLVMSMTAQKF